MAELIKKKTMLDWVQKQVEAVTKKQVAGSDGIFTREVLTTMQRDLSAFENAINAMPTTTEAEIRNRAIDETVAKLKDWMFTHDGLSENDIRKINEIAEQLRERE